MSDQISVPTNNYLLEENESQLSVTEDGSRLMVDHGADDPIEIERAMEELRGLHRRLCPRQVLGVRLGILGGRLSGINLPQSDKRLFVFVETDGCALDGVTAATGCSVGRRTMRVLDFGKVAATFVDVHTGRAFRIAPKPGIREAAWRYAPQAYDRWTAQLKGYQVMPSMELLQAHPVIINFNLKEWIGEAGYRVTCELCGEEIMNRREIVHEGKTLCRACHGEVYYQFVVTTDGSLISARD